MSLLQTAISGIKSGSKFLVLLVHTSTIILTITTNLIPWRMFWLQSVISGIKSRSKSLTLLLLLLVQCRLFFQQRSLGVKNRVDYRGALRCFVQSSKNKNIFFSRPDTSSYLVRKRYLSINNCWNIFLIWNPYIAETLRAQVSARASARPFLWTPRQRGFDQPPYTFL